MGSFSTYDPTSPLSFLILLLFVRIFTSQNHQKQFSAMKRYRNGEIWDFEHEVAVATNRQVILGLDGGTTSTVCICMPMMPFSDTLPHPLPVLARAVAGCSNHNSVGGNFSHSLFCLF